MNSNYMGKAGIQVEKKLVFLFVFALVTLTYAAIPLTAFAACPNDNNDNTVPNAPITATATVTNATASTRNNRRVSSNTSTSLTQIFATLETKSLQFIDSTGNPVVFSSLQTQKPFGIIASDTTTTQRINATLLSKTLARINLPGNVQQQILFDNIVSPCLLKTSFLINISGSTTQKTAQCLDKNSASVAIPGSSIITMVFPQTPVR